MTASLRAGVANDAYLQVDGVDVLKIEAEGNVTLLNGNLVGAVETGDFKFAQRKSTPVGWIVANGSTIGNAGSGAGRANTDTLALFTLWWTDYTDAQLPILTNAGAASKRGASAAADWAAGKRLTVFDLVTAGHFPRPAGPGVANGMKYADAFASHNHPLTDNGHSHPYLRPNASGTSASFGGGGAPVDPGTGTTSVSATGITMQNTGGTETTPKHIGMLPLYKL